MTMDSPTKARNATAPIAELAGCSGLELVARLADGSICRPSMAETLPFTLLPQEEGKVGLLASLVWWDDWTPRRRAAYDDRDVVVRRRRPRVVEIDDTDDGVVDVADEPVVDRRRVTTRRTTYDGF